MGNEVSPYGDIYSYGILLLEMFTGKRPTDSIFQDNLNLHDFVKAALSEQKIDIIDPNLLWERQEEETRRINNTRNEDQNGSSKIQKCLILILEIGVACSIEFPRERMNINIAVVGLHKIRESILKTSIQRQRVRPTGKFCFSIDIYVCVYIYIYIYNLVMYPPTPIDLINLIKPFQMFKGII